MDLFFLVDMEDETVAVVLGIILSEEFCFATLLVKINSGLICERIVCFKSNGSNGCISKLRSDIRDLYASLYGYLGLFSFLKVR